MKGARSRSGASSKADSKLSVKKAAAGKGGKKAGKDPNKPKRPPSAFFVFMEEFRKEFNEKNPHNKAVSAVGKAAGARWKAMSEADKAPFVSKAAKRKADYEKQMTAYNKKQAGGGNEPEDDESDKSKSEVNDEEDESGEEEDEE